jgi:arylsulfatase A-like enzyme
MKQIEQPTGGLRAVLAFCAFLLAPWALRCVSLVDEGIVPAAADLRGFVADLAVGCLATALVWPLARLWRGLGALAAVALALLAAANFQTVTALGSVAALGDFHFLGDRTFLLGSVLTASRPWLLAALLVLSGVLAWRGLPRLGARPAAGGAAFGVALLGLAWAAPGDTGVDDWRRVNVVQHNAQAWLLGARADRGWIDPPRAMLERLPELAANLEGEPRFAWQPARRNVLLVVLEGVSGAYIEPLARAHGRGAAMHMSELDRVVREGIGYASFVNHNRRTNRGLYALLCGELPSLPSGIAKMTVAASAPWQRCLPEILGDAGYRTAYLQAAPLAFMVKGRFMARAGFQEVEGDRVFEHAYLRSQWGVDDRAFFEHAAAKVEELDAGRRPWFLTLLTVGTHHPYTVPPPVAPGSQPESVRGAFAYLDAALGGFMQRIEELGIRDDTLILFVSDESAGDWGRASDPTSARLTQNWGFAAVLLPEGHRAQVREPYAQIDVAVSILDYLGMRDTVDGLFGRSLLRRYATGRHLFFANLNWRSFGALDPAGRVVYCEYEGWRCTTWHAADGRIFAGNLQPLPPDPALEQLLVDVAERSRAPRQSGALHVPLLSDPRFEVDRRERQVVYGVSDLSLDPNEWLEVEVDVEARGEGRAELDHFLRMRDKSEIVRGISVIESGQRLRMRYTLAPSQRVGPLGIRSETRLVDGWRVELLYRKRRFVVHRGGERPAPGLVLERWELLPTRGAEPRVQVMPADEIDAIARRLDATPDES